MPVRWRRSHRLQMDVRANEHQDVVARDAPRKRTDKETAGDDPVGGSGSSHGTVVGEIKCVESSLTREYPWWTAGSPTLPEGSRRLAAVRRAAELLEQSLWVDGVHYDLTGDGTTVIVSERTRLSRSRLVALNLETSGALRWMIGETDPNAEPRLANAVFLGAGEVVGENVFVLVEQAKVIRLVQIAANTGKLEWSLDVKQLAR